MAYGKCGRHLKLGSCLTASADSIYVIDIDIEIDVREVGAQAHGTAFLREKLHPELPKISS